jgi:hypothetical protein
VLAELHERATRVLGGGDPLARESALHLARSLVARGEPAEALALLVEAREASGPEDETALALANLQGPVLLDLARPEEAEPLLADVAARMRATMGAHPGTAVALQNQGRALLALGRADDAETVLLECHRMGVELFGPGHALPRRVSGFLAEACAALGREDEARAWRERRP